MTTNLKHGWSGKPEYRIWVGMRRRCRDKNEPLYGAKGVKVCSEWDKDFAAFLAYVGPRPSPKHSIDRYPNSAGNYEPGNVRWATSREQMLNRNPRQRGSDGKCLPGQVRIHREQSTRKFRFLKPKKPSKKVKVNPSESWVPIAVGNPEKYSLILGWGFWAGEISGPHDGPDVYLVCGRTQRPDYPGYDWIVHGTDANSAWVKALLWKMVATPEGK